jgi:hypothetical protein
MITMAASYVAARWVFQVDQRSALFGEATIGGGEASGFEALYRREVARVQAAELRVRIMTAFILVDAGLRVAHDLCNEQAPGRIAKVTQDVEM